MKPKFQIGDRVWIAQVSYSSKEITCPICDGYKTVILESKSGERWEMDCRYCAPGYDPPTGIVKEEYEYAAESLFKTVSGVENRQGSFYYVFANWHSGSYEEGDLFNQRDDADDKAIQIAKKQIEARQERDEHRKKNDRKSYSWHVGYYQRQAAQARKEAEWAERKARYMSTKVRKPKT